MSVWSSAVVDHLAEVAVPHLRGGDVVLVEVTLAQAHAFVGDEPEALVLPVVELGNQDGSAGGSSELVANELGGSVAVLALAGAQAVGIVAERLEDAAVESNWCRSW